MKTLGNITRNAAAIQNFRTTLVTHPLRIGYLVPQFPGQTHMFFWREIHALEEMGHDVHVLSTRMPPEGIIAHEWSRDAMARTTYLGRLHPGHALGGVARLIPRGLPLWMARGGAQFARDAALAVPAAEALLAYCREHRLHHVHVHSCGRAALVAGFARRAGNVPYSLTLHGPLKDYGPGQPFKWERASFATIITQRLLSEVEETLSGHLPPRLVVQAMGVDTDKLRRSVSYALPEKGRPVRLFSCARLNVIKGHKDSMSAMRQLLDQGVDVRLEIAGEDDDGGHGYRAELEAHLKKLRLQDHVRLLGALDADAVRAKLEEAHIFVLPSLHEPLGVAYMEAMSMGVPTIASNDGGAPELIDDGRDGRLITPGKPAELARTIRDLAADSDMLQRFSDEGRKTVVSRFRSSMGAETLVREITALQNSETGIA